MMALGFLAATWITARAHARGWARPGPLDLDAALVHGRRGRRREALLRGRRRLRTGAPFCELVFAREGITWYGGLIGGTARRRSSAAASTASRSGSTRTCVGGREPRSARRSAASAASSSGDDYGRPTDVPLGVAFPQGAPPTLDAGPPDAALRGGLARRRRRPGSGAAGSASPFLFGEYLALNGLGRFVDRDPAREPARRPRAHGAAVDRDRARSCSARRAGCTSGPRPAAGAGS